MAKLLQDSNSEGPGGSVGKSAELFLHKGARAEATCIGYQRLALAAVTGRLPASGDVFELIEGRLGGFLACGLADPGELEGAYRQCSREIRLPRWCQGHRSGWGPSGRRWTRTWRRGPGRPRANSLRATVRWGACWGSA